MLQLGRVTKVKVLFLVLVYVFNFDLFEFSAAILEKGLLFKSQNERYFYFYIKLGPVYKEGGLRQKAVTLG